MNRRGFCIFIDTLCQGAVPSVKERSPNAAANAPDRICVFPTELEAQREIVDMMMIRLQEFLDGERDFDDSMTVEEYIVEVDVCPDGSVLDENGTCFR